MAQPISTHEGMTSTTQASRRVASMVAVGGAGLGAAVLLGAVVLWFHYGTAVFFEMISSGFAACF